MPIKFHCPSCSSAIKAPDTHAGQTLPCPKCGQPVVVAADAQPSAVAPSPPAFPQAQEPEPIDDIPEIVTRDSRSYAVPSSPTSTPPATDAFASPQTRTDRVFDADLQNIRIVDLNIPFKSVFKFSLQFFLCNLLLGAVVSILFMIFAALLALVGIGASM